MYAKSCFCILFFLFFTLYHSFGQEITVDSVIITEKNFYGDPAPLLFRDTNRFEAILDKIQQNTSGQLQMTSPGGLATFQYRGFAGRHIPVLWNGFNIQSITNGTFDLALLPNFLFKQPVFHEEIQSSLVGNNAFSGGFVLGTKSNPTPTFQIEADYSSLQNVGLNAGLQLKRKKTVYNLGFIQRYDKNVFSYDSSGSSVKRLPTDFVNTHMAAEIAHQFSKSWSAGLDVWFQNSKRNILNDTLFIFAYPVQEDKNLKANASVTYQLPKILFTWNTVYSRENLEYYDNNLSLPLQSNAIVTGVQNTLQFFEKEFSPLHFYLRQRYDLAEATFFDDKKSRNTLQLGGSWFTEWPNDGKFQISARQDMVDGKLLTPSLRVDMGHYGYMLHVYNNYQLPNFNDLYYPGGGNPDLKPESSVNIEINKTFQWKNRKLKAEVFTYWINNLIQWIPTDSTGWVWSPFNQQFVFSRGFQLDYQENIPFGKSSLRYGLSYGFTAAEIREHETLKSFEGNQIIYTPGQKARAEFGFRFGKQDLVVIADWTGKRYISADNSASLPSFLLVQAGYGISLGSLAFRVDAYNLLNQRYQFVNGYPLPGINGKFTIRYTMP